MRPAHGGSGDTGGDDVCPPEPTIQLLERIQAGDRAAADVLFARYYPRVRKWVTGRLPRHARDLAETSDLVQDVLLRTFARIDTLHVGRDGGLQAYLGTAVRHAILDEISRRRLNRVEHEGDVPDDGASTVDLVIRRADLERYERALELLGPRDREALVARLEFGCTYAEVAAEIDCPSANAARKVVERAMVRLLDVMQQERPSPAS